MGLEAVELLHGVQQLFGVDIPDEEATRILTVGALRDSIVGKLAAKGRENVNPDIVFDQLKVLIPHHLGISRDEVTPEARFEDLYL